MGSGIKITNMKSLDIKESIYTELYRSISEKWINKNVFNHMWTIFFNDEKLKTILFDLGYGSYLIDAFKCGFSRTCYKSFMNCKCYMPLLFCIINSNA